MIVYHKKNMIGLPLVQRLHTAMSHGSYDQFFPTLDRMFSKEKIRLRGIEGKIQLAHGVKRESRL